MIIKRIIVCFFIGITIGAVFDYLTPYDENDNKLDRNRSGLKLFTDHLTGCQYIK